MKFMNKTVWKKIHNIFGLSSALFLFLLLSTGILLNHPSWLDKDEATALAADPKVPSRIYEGKKDGLFVSGDTGRTWNDVPMLYPPQNVADIRFSNDGKEIYVVEKWGRVILSKDGGKIWENIALPFDPQVEGVELKSATPGAGGSLCLFTSHGWLLSKDGGKSWDASRFDKRARPLHRLILTVHNGYFFGPKFVWLYDFSALALLVLIVSGIVLWKIGRSVA
jgi:hypothetical protein